METSITNGQTKQLKRFAEDAVDRAIAEGLLDKGSIQKIIESGGEFQIGIIAGIKEFVLHLKNSFRVTVDYSKSLAEMIQSGNYYWVNSNITEHHFPLQGKGKQEFNIELIHYDKHMESDEVIRDLGNRGLRSITLPELLSFGAAYPDQQGKFPIISLGSVWQFLRDRQLFPYLYSCGLRRELDLNIRGVAWDDDFRFAAVRK